MLTLRMLYLGKQFSFYKHGIKASLSNYSWLRHFFKCVNLTFDFFRLNFPDFAKASSSYNILLGKLIFKKEVSNGFYVILRLFLVLENAIAHLDEFLSSKNMFIFSN